MTYHQLKRSIDTIHHLWMSQTWGRHVVYIHFTCAAFDIK